MAKKRVTFVSALWGSIENRVRRLVGLPPVSAQRQTLSSWAKTGIQREIMAFLGLERTNPLPDGWPVDVFECLDRWVQAKGGYMQLGDGLRVPLLKLNRKSAVTLSSFWVAYVDFEHESAKWDALKSAEEALEDALARECDQQLNVRILSKPARIEIDNPTPPMITLASQWRDYIDGRNGVTPLRYFLGMESTPQGDLAVDNRLDNSNEYSCAWFGAAGSGKTQSMTDALLTLCATTSPEELSVIVIDPKGLDFPVNGIPHLACEVVTDPALACNVILSVGDLLAQRAKNKSRSASRKRVLLMVDELGYLIQSGNAEIADALTSIAAMGRAWGISLFIGSQRATNEFFPKSIHSNLPAKWVGRVKDSSEAVFASGQAGCDAHKLPGKGAAMLYEPTGVVRLQSAYIGDANKDDYPQVVGVFIADLQRKWQGKQPHWRLGGQVADTATADDLVRRGEIGGIVEETLRRVLSEMATVTPASETTEDEPEKPAVDPLANNGVISPEATVTLDEIGDDTLDALVEVYQGDPAKFSVRRMRKFFEERGYGRLSAEREKRYYSTFMAYVS